MTKITRHRGVTIAAVKIVRYEVRRADGRVMKTYAKRAAAVAYVDGYVKALQRYAPKDQNS